MNTNEASMDVSTKIIQYLKEYPYARDTRRGVARWWVGLTEETVADALEDLCQRGVLTRSTHNDQILYSRNPHLDPNRLEHALRGEAD
ncbi:MAG: hypothetical protein JRF33_22800 [Deltaproteobacteria bacterium]|nr:hypothetical protein [Deltaproteobacteria bacterium]